MGNKTNTTDDRRDRFMRLAPKRTQKVLKAMDILANCSNRSNYIFTDAQAEKIISAVEEKLEEVKVKFRASKSSDFEL